MKKKLITEARFGFMHSEPETPRLKKIDWLKDWTEINNEKHGQLCDSMCLRSSILLYGPYTTVLINQRKFDA